MQEDKQKPIEYDKANDTWDVYLEGNKFKCNNKDDAIFLDSNIKELVDGMRNYDSFKNDTDKRQRYIERLEQAVAIIKNSQGCYAFRMLIDFAEERRNDILK